MTHPRALVVDDDLPIRSLIGKVLERTGIDVTLAKDGAEAIRFFDSGRFDVIVLDLMMPAVSGYDVLDHVETRLSDYTAVIVVTAGSDAEVVRLQGRRVHSVLRKPFDIAVIGDVVSTVAAEMAAAYDAKVTSEGRVIVVEFNR